MANNGRRNVVVLYDSSPPKGNPRRSPKAHHRSRQRGGLQDHCHNHNHCYHCHHHPRRSLRESHVDKIHVSTKAYVMCAMLGKKPMALFMITHPWSVIFLYDHPNGISFTLAIFQNEAMIALVEILALLAFLF